MCLLLVSGPPKPVLPGVGGGGGGDLVPDFTAASVARDDVEDMFDLITAAGAGKIGLIPAGTATWTSGISWTPPANTTIIGAGSLSTVGGGDVTTITDAIDRSGSDLPLLAIDIPTTGVFRLAGLTVEGTATNVSPLDARITYAGAVRLNGSSGAQFRLDHNHFDQGAFTQIGTSGQIYGVIDSSIFEIRYGTALRFHAGQWGGQNFGDGSWSDDTTLGSNRFVFAEDNVFDAPIDGGVQDGYQAPRFVIRYNTLNVAATQTHPTGGSNRARGVRAWEIYGNTANASNDDAQFNFFFMSSGTGVVWGNSAPTGYTHFITAHSIRRFLGSYNQLVPPDGWGWCGPANQSATVNVTDTGGGSFTTVTKTAGTNFDTNWPAGSMIKINGTTNTIASVSSTTVLILGTSASSLTGATAVFGSPWDGNTTVYGYPALDQPGRGKCDAMSGEFPNAIVTGAGVAQWPNQAAEPAYIWSNTWTTPPGAPGNFVDTEVRRGVQDDRDFFTDIGTFTGALTGAGIGVGPIASRPATCEVGVAYIATDEGRTDVSPTVGSITVGKMYVCTATNTWTARYGGSSSNSAGLPYTYPHPLRSP